MANEEQRKAPVPRRIPAPRALPETQAFWDAADQGRLLVKRCDDCSRFHHYPRDVCPHCMSTRTRWQDAAGTGTLYSFSTMGRGEAAYTMAFVTLDEGVTMMTNIVDCDPRALEIGQRVTVAFVTSEAGNGAAGHAVPMFRPIS